MFPWGIAAGVGGSLLGGILGGQDDPQLPPEQKRLYDFLFRQAKRLRRYGQGAPMSGLDERQAQASARGQAGELLQQKRQQAYAAMPEGSPAQGDFMAGLAGTEVGVLSGIDFNSLMASLESRRDARYGGAASIAAMAGGPAGGQRYQQQQPDLGPLFA